ncbi:hypothetical protein Dimus_025847 [Dionaea muscipula]
MGSLRELLVWMTKSFKNPNSLKPEQPPTIAASAKRDMATNHVDRVRAADKGKEIIVNGTEDAAALQFILSGGTDKEAINVLEQRDIDLAVQLSIASAANESFFDCLDDDEDRFLPRNTPMGSSSSGKQWKSPVFVCDICSDDKYHEESFSIMGCDHSYCSDCVRNYVASKLENGVSQITCPVPNCNGLLDPEYCRDILPLDVYVRWGKSLCESVISASQKFYCPFKDCSAMMINDGAETVTKSECLNCHRLFCAQCKVAWHDGVDCGEYQKLNEDERGREDIMLRKLANNNKWRRCPICKIYVERTKGCNYIVCRCRVSFCYNCGAINNDHVHHRCPQCNLIWS